MRDWMTFKEVEEAYNIKADNLRSYINHGRGKIPDDAIDKIGRQWFIKRDWVEKNYKRREKDG